MRKLTPGGEITTMLFEDVYIVEFDPTKVSVFQMFLTGGYVIMAAPPEATNPLDYPEEVRSAYSNLYNFSQIN